MNKKQMKDAIEKKLKSAEETLKERIKDEM